MIYYSVTVLGQIGDKGSKSIEVRPSIKIRKKYYSFLLITTPCVLLLRLLISVHVDDSSPPSLHAAPTLPVLQLEILCSGWRDQTPCYIPAGPPLGFIVNV